MDLYNSANGHVGISDITYSLKLIVVSVRCSREQIEGPAVLRAADASAEHHAKILYIERSPVG